MANPMSSTSGLGTASSGLAPASKPFEPDPLMPQTNPEPWLSSASPGVAVPNTYGGQQQPQQPPVVTQEMRQSSSNENIRIQMQQLDTFEKEQQAKFALEMESHRKQIEAAQVWL